MKARLAFLSGRTWLNACVAVIALALFSGCKPVPNQRVQGYIEGEFVYVASPLAGQLDSLSVQRGAQVRAGEPLFALEHGLEVAAKDEAVRKLAQGNRRHPHPSCPSGPPPHAPACH